MTGYRKRSISKNLTISLVAVMALLSCSFLGLYYVQISGRLDQRFEETANEAVSSMANTLKAPLWRMDWESIDMICSYYSSNEYIVMVKLIDASGNTMIDKHTRAKTTASGKETVRTRDIHYGKEKIGTILLSFSSFEFTRVKYEMFRAIATAILILIAGMAVLTGFLLRKIIRGPIDGMAAIAQSYSRGDYRPRVEAAVYQEFEPIVSVLVDMGQTIESQMNDLKKAEQSLKGHSDNLEEMVARRTWELEGLNQKLENEIQNRQLTQDLLKTSEGRLTAILRSSPVGMGLVVGRNLEWANDTLCRMVGYPKDSILSKSTALLYADPEEYERVGREVASASFTKWDPCNVETQWIRRDGSVFDCNLQACPFDIRDLSRGYIIVVSDITGRKESERTLRENDRIQGILELSGAVCHEMNQPLMSAFGYLDLLRMDLPDNEPVQKSVLKIKAQLERMSDITKKIMKISRYQTKDYLNEQILDLSKTSQTETRDSKDPAQTR